MKSTEKHTDKYFKMLVEDLHTSVMATIDPKGHPHTRAIDLMLYDQDGLYFLSARGKSFCEEVLDQHYVSLTSTNGTQAISFSGDVKPVGHSRLEEIFENNPYMKEIYPAHTRKALEVFQIYSGFGEFFDLSNPGQIFREEFSFNRNPVSAKYEIDPEKCTGCRQCTEVCPQSCIEICEKTAIIDTRHCLHCGNCYEACPEGAVCKHTGGSL